MSSNNPDNPGASTTGTSQFTTPDTQTVIGLLGNLLPLLLQIQQQSRGPAFQSGLMQEGAYPSNPAQPAFGQLGLDQWGAGSLLGNIASANPMLDHRAAVDLVEDIAAHSLRTLSTYLETYAGQYQDLESCVPIVTQAARCFAVHDYAQTLALIWQTYRAVTALRAQNPQLPPLRAVGFAGAPAPSSTAIIH